MRELTFLGFSTEYVRSLSKSGTTSVFTLAKEAASDNPRLREPLLLYALASDKKDILLRAAKRFGLVEFYVHPLSVLEGNTLEDIMGKGLLPEGYQKVWRSYLAKKNSHYSDDMTKEMMRNRILSLQKEKGVTNYRLYTDLKINPGNLNSWLKHGGGNKISLDRARDVLRYLSENN